MGLPNVLKNYNLFVDGDNYAGQVAEMAMPKLAEKLESWRGGGMLGEIDISMGIEKLETEIKFGGLVPGVLSGFARPGAGAVQLRFVGAYQGELSGAVSAAELVLHGRYAEIDPGTAQAGSKNETAVKASLVYLKWSINGRTMIEVDMINNVLVIDGIDRMAEIRAILAS
jgi:uncharacterized protein